MLEFKAIILLNGQEVDYFTLEAENAFDANLKAQDRVFKKAYPHLSGKAKIVVEEA